MAWIAYVIAWLAAALFWTLAGASSSGRPPLEALPFGLLAMGSAAVLGLVVWRLTGRIEWSSRKPSFYAIHATGLVLYSVLYATSWIWVDLARGRAAEILPELRRSPVLIWNLLMGSWLYLLVAGISYAIRAHQRVRAQEAATAEAHLLAEQAQLAALRAQVNPHFLFNALHSVGALVTSDPVRADKALESLGDLLRYALGTEHEVLFGQEWRFTQDYLSFEQLRLGDRLRVDAVAQPAALSVLVPPLILQPLVENAVRHGIADRRDGGRVQLNAHIVDSQLIVHVQDDGNGNAGPSREGFGLKSIERRLAARYGREAKLDIERSASGFHVTIQLPVQSATDLDSAE
jgi:sensor histidine kinase YesM